jgi:hypothetical protein
MQNVPQFVLKRLQEKVVADSHPDADLLTAFTEQSLAKGERALVLEHLAACGDCRDVVALVLPEAERVSAVTSVVPARNWLRWPSFGWGALAAGVIVVASTGVMEYSHRNQEQTAALNVGQTGAVLAPSALDRASSVQAGVPPGAMGKNGLPAAVPSRADRLAGQARVGGGVSQVDSNLNAAAERAAFADESQIAAAEQRNRVKAVERQAEIGPGSISSAPIDRTVVAENQITPPPNGRSLADLNIVKAKDPVPAQAGTNTAPGSSSMNSGSGQMSPPASQSTAVRTSPLWSISPSGGLQRSFDGGNTWQRINPAENSARLGQARANPKPDAAINPAAINPAAINSATPVFRAVAATGREVWAGGTAGVLYHTSDGDHWARVIPSTAAATLTGDIISIQFADSQHGKIATSTPELWTTVDDGQSWQKRP